MDAAITAVPPERRRRLMVTRDRAGASHGLIARTTIRHGGNRTGSSLSGRPRLLPSDDLISLIAGTPKALINVSSPATSPPHRPSPARRCHRGKTQAPADCPRATHDDEPLNLTEHHRRQDHT
jgi:hypothetical protein